MKYMFDTMVLNEIIKRQIDVTAFDKAHEYFITAVQHGEILKTQCPSLRKKLLDGLGLIEGNIRLKRTHIHSAPWGHFPWGYGPWGEGTGTYYKPVMQMLAECSGNNSKRGNNADALIIEVCKIEKLTLVSQDPAVRKVCSAIGVHWVRFESFLNQNQMRLN